MSDSGSRGKNWVIRPWSLPAWLLLIVGVGCLKILAAQYYLTDSSFAPDEVLYLEILGSLRAGEDSFDLGTRMGYGAEFVAASWPLVGPAWIFTDLGIPPLMSLRLASVVTSSISAAILLGIITIFRSKTPVPGDDEYSAWRQGSRISLTSAAGISILVFLLLPSHALWTTVALREAPSELFALLAALGVALAIQRLRMPVRALGWFFVLVGTAGLHLSRSYLSAFIVIAVFAVTFWRPRLTRPQISLMLIASVLCGYLAGQALRTSIDSSSDITQSVSAPATVLPNVPQPAAESNPAITEETAPASLPESLASQIVSLVDSRVTTLAGNRGSFMQGADSAYPTNYCQDAERAVDTALCEVRNLPLGLSRFLIQPLLAPWNVPQKSTQLFASIENYLWLVLLVAVLLTLIGRHTRNARFVTFLVVYAGLAIIGYALISGNAGTAFRHKSQFLWVFCLVIALGWGWRPWVSSVRRSIQSRVSRARGTITGIGEGA